MISLNSSIMIIYAMCVFYAIFHIMFSMEQVKEFYFDWSDNLLDIFIIKFVIIY